MTITTSCLIPIMAIGNKIVILCTEASELLFPFDQTPPCILPIANQSALAFLLQKVCKEHASEVIVLAPAHPEILRLTQQYQVAFIKKEADYPAQLHQLGQHAQRLLLIKGEVLLHEADMEQLLKALAQKQNYALIKELDRDTRSIDVFACAVDTTIRAIYAHPREHYVDAQMADAYVVDQSCCAAFAHMDRGYHQINCGQMPDEQYHIEEAMQQSLEQGQILHPLSTQEQSVTIVFPWDLAKANELAAYWVNDVQQDAIHEDTTWGPSCQKHGYLQTGYDVIIEDGVRFEGNCLIGNHVRIEQGAIIGRNCVIGDGSQIRYGCKLSDATVIGPHNKIGYHAEVSGVTFDGVCAVHACEIFGIIGRKVDIAAGVTMAILRFDDTNVVQRIRGKSYSNPYTNRICIGDYCRTGVNNVFLPGVKVGNRCAIGPGIVVDQDIEEQTLVLWKQELIKKQWGSSRYGW